MSDNLGKITHQISEQGAPIIEKLLDKLTGKGASITYTFENMKLEMPKAEGPKGQLIGSGKLTVNGRITISAVIHKKENENNQDMATESINDEGLGIQGYSSSNNVTSQMT